MKLVNNSSICQRWWKCSGQAQCGYRMIGVDYNVDQVEARKSVGPNITLQGNLKPADMYLSEVVLSLYFLNDFL